VILQISWCNNKDCLCQLLSHRPHFHSLPFKLSIILYLFPLKTQSFPTAFARAFWYPNTAQGRSLRNICKTSPCWRNWRWDFKQLLDPVIINLSVNCLIVNEQTVGSDSTLQYTSVKFSTLQYTSVHFSTLQYTSVHFSTLQYTSVHFSTLQYLLALHSLFINNVTHVETFLRAWSRYLPIS